jgi:HK97 family phage major capsid protein
MMGMLQALQELKKTGRAVVEASALTGSGSGVGGRIETADTFASLRFANPFRAAASQQTIAQSDIQFVIKSGNAANSTNPWLYAVTPNSGSPNVATSIWQLPMRVVAAQLPVRSAAFEDIPNLAQTLESDLDLEFSALEAQSMAVNNDQAGSATTSTGATSGLRGLAMYAGTAGSAAAFGTSGTAITNGIHTIRTVGVAAGTCLRSDLIALANALPGQYWSMQGTAWMMHPTVIQLLRAQGTAAPTFPDVGTNDGGALAHVFGWPVICNSFLSSGATAGDFPIYLANWPRFMHIVDYGAMTMQLMDQTQPGTVTLFAQKRLVSTVRDVFAGVRAIST